MEVRAFAPVRRSVGAALADPAGQAVDLVLVEFAGLAPLVPPSRSVPWVLTLHNLPSRMAAQQAAVMPRRRQRWLLRRDARIAGAFERQMAARFDAVITTTAEDATALAGADKALASRILVVPNGTDVDRLAPSPVPTTPRVVFTGALYTTPNVDGAIWFCHHVLPAILEAQPAVEVDIVGARPTAAVTQLGRLPGVSVHPDVADITPFLAAARVAVVPIRVGSGSRLKALEAMAAGRPVVGTTVGLEGLHIVPGVEALVADDAGAFAAAVVRLLDDDDVAGALAQAGRVAAEQRFAWPAIADHFAAAMVEIAERSAAGAAAGPA
jgi:glycosyltransferase involved in cell wall biosynthesis